MYISSIFDYNNVIFSVSIIMNLLFKKTDIDRYVKNNLSKHSEHALVNQV